MLCYKRQGNYAACNELPSTTDFGWVIVRRTVGFGSLGVRIWNVIFNFFLFLSFFPYIVSIFRVGLVLGLGLGLVLGIGLGLELSSVTDRL